MVEDQMTKAKVANPDAITRREAARLLGVSESQVRRYRRDGLLGCLDGYPSYSRSQVKSIMDDAWLSGREASKVLGVSHVRVSQLAAADRIPSYVAPSGRRYYRSAQLTTVANARRARQQGFSIG
jgi:DNA-binding transcriptional MerR regulator